jgi:hypothetical protein
VQPVERQVCRGRWDWEGGQDSLLLLEVPTEVAGKVQAVAAAVVAAVALRLASLGQTAAQAVQKRRMDQLLKAGWLAGLAGQLAWAAGGRIAA